jgi:hypothetical protein
MYASVATSPSATQALRQPCHASRLRVTRLHRLYVTNAVHRDYSYPGCIGSTMSRAASTRLPVTQALLRLCRASGHAKSPLDFSTVGRTGSRRAPSHCVSWRDYSLSGLHRLYCTYAVHPDAPSRRSTSRQSVALALAVCSVILLCVVITRLVAATDILHLRHVSGCLGTSRGSSRGSSCHSSLTTSLTSHVRVPRLVARLVVDFFAYAVCPSASARRAARRQLLHLVQACSRLLHLVQARHRLLRLRRASGCLDTSRGSSCGSSCRSSSTTSLTLRVRVPRHVAPLVVDYFDYVGASARRTARLQLIRLRCASRCLGTSHGLSSTTLPRAGSSSTTSPTPRVRVPRHVARLIVDYFASCRLVVNYFAYIVRPGASACRAARR